MDIPAMYLIVAGVLVALGIGIGIGLTVRKLLFVHFNKSKIADATEDARRLLQQAQEKAEAYHREMVESADAESSRRQRIFDKRTEETRRALRRTKHQIEQRQEKLARRVHQLTEREKLLHQATEALEALRKEAERHRHEAESLRGDAEDLLRQTTEREKKAEQRESELENRKVTLASRESELEQLAQEHVRKLEQVANLTIDEARKMLLEQILDETRLNAASLVKEIRDEARLTANRQARKVVLTAIQRTAASHTIENTVSVVNIQSDEMKGRIIGREGRNIRAFEAATGIEVIVDDTPEAVILSGFDPVRREIARLALLKLLQDGRIHPARIEEVVEKVRQDIDEEIVETGERTSIDLGLHGLHPELIRLVGRMRYRSSYGQNLLAHSIEVAKLSSLMASELNLDARKARRAGLLHDIGKVVEGDLESPHAIVGMELCRKFKEHPDVCNAVGAHHDEIEMTGPMSPIVQAADAISGARPGARRESLESYIKRLEKLEEVASSFNGVERVYAIQAGREIRVIVNHDLISDAQAEQLAIDVSKRIEDEMQYPGQIKITVIREVRSVSYAK